MAFVLLHQGEERPQLRLEVAVSLGVVQIEEGRVELATELERGLQDRGLLGFDFELLFDHIEDLLVGQEEIRGEVVDLCVQLDLFDQLGDVLA